MSKQNIRVFVIVGGIFLTCLIASSLFLSSHQPEEDDFMQHASFTKEKKRGAKAEAMTSPVDANFWKTVKLDEEIPAKVHDLAKHVEVKTNTVNIMSVDTFYREAIPPKGADVSGESVVLLHGAAFKSSTWLTLGTINLLAAMGHRVIALDLPGYGNSKGGNIDTTEKGKYLSETMKALSVKFPILLSPSMSGGFSVPYLINFGNLGGFIPVAPVGTTEITDQIKVPTLILYGEKDKSLGTRSLENLIRIPTSQAIVLPNAGHPAYLDQPEMFHKLLYNFIKQVHLHKPQRE